MFTRDSSAWYWIMGAAIITAVSTRMDLLDALFPEAYHKQIHAVIELLSLVVLAVAGKMSMSPLPISEQGRQNAIAQRVDSANTAAMAGAVASEAAADAADKATIAVEAAKVAVTESIKAADPIDTPKEQK